MGFTDDPGAGGDVEVDHDEADDEVDVGAVPDAVHVGQNVSDQGCNPDVNVLKKVFFPSSLMLHSKHHSMRKHCCLD